MRTDPPPPRQTHRNEGGSGGLPAGRLSGLMCSWGSVSAVLRVRFLTLITFTALTQEGGGEFNIHLHAYGTHEANAGGFALLYCIRETRAMCILPPPPITLTQ